jgi:hypothetical protein
MDMSLQLLEGHAAKGGDFLLNIMAGDKSWFHHFDPETKW